MAAQWIGHLGRATGEVRQQGVKELQRAIQEGGWLDIEDFKDYDGWEEREG